MCFFAAVTARVRGRPMGETIRTLRARSYLHRAPVYAPIVALLAFMYVRVSPWTLALFLVPAMAAQRLYGLYQEQRQLASDLSVSERDPRGGEPPVRVGSHRNSRRERPVHGRPLGGCRHLLERHRRADGPTAGSTEAGLSLRARARHRKDRASAGASGEARSADARGATADAGALRDRRADPRARGRVLGDRHDRPSSPRAHRRRGISGRSRQRRHPARVQDHRRGRRVQRDDLRPPVPRRDAEQSRAPSPGAGRRQSVRHRSRRGVRGDSRRGERGVPSSHSGPTSASSRRAPTKTVPDSPEPVADVA